MIQKLIAVKSSGFKNSSPDSTTTSTPSSKRRSTWATKIRTSLNNLAGDAADKRVCAYTHGAVLCLLSRNLSLRASVVGQLSFACNTSLYTFALVGRPSTQLDFVAVLDTLERDTMQALFAQLSSCGGGGSGSSGGGSSSGCRRGRCGITSHHGAAHAVFASDLDGSLWAGDLLHLRAANLACS